MSIKEEFRINARYLAENSCPQCQGWSEPERDACRNTFGHAVSHFSIAYRNLFLSIAIEALKILKK